MIDFDIASLLNPFSALEMVFDFIEGTFTTFLPALNQGLDAINVFLSILVDFSSSFPAILIGGLITAIGVRTVFNFF